MASPQLKNGFIGIANDIWDEIISRKFTERQQKILKLILRLSYGCQKKVAIIPQLNHFELCGVRIQDAKKEITYLEQCKVIQWDQMQTYALNKNYDEWKVSLVKGWDDGKFKDLISLNLNNRVTKSVTLDEKNNADSYEKCNFGVTKSVTDDLRKVEVNNNQIPRESKSEVTPKDRFKDSVKNNSSYMSKPNNVVDTNDEGILLTRQDTVPVTPETNTDFAQVEISSEVNDYRNAVANKYLQRRGKGLQISMTDEMEINDFLKHQVLTQTVLDGIDKAFDSFKPKHIRDEIRSLKFCSPFIYSLHASKQNKKIEQPTSQADIMTDTTHTAEDVQAALAQLRAKG